MKVLALTGNIAAGKSTVAAILRSHGVSVIDSDAIVHELQRPGTTVYREIVAHFGNEMLLDNGELNRHRLRDHVMRDAAARKALEAIVHPAVALRQLELLDHERARGSEIVIVDIPLLFEAGDPDKYDGVILIDAPADLRRQRLVEQRGIAPDEADRLINSQLPSAAKRSRATWILDNEGSQEYLEEQTRNLWLSLQG